MGVKLGNGKWAIKEDKLLAYNDNSGRFFNKEFDFSRGSSATYVDKDGLIKTAGLQATNLVNNGDFSELGSELVVNGNFSTNSDWNLGSGQWTILNGFAVADNASNNLHTSNAVATATGLQYKVTFTLQDVAQGYVNVGLSNLNSTQFNSDGTHTLYIESSGNRFLYFRPVGFTGKLTNVSVKQVDPNDYWTVGGSWSLSEDKADYLATGNGSSLSQSNVFTNTGLHKISFTISEVASGQNARILIESSSEVYLPLTSLGNGNYTYYVNATASNNLIVRGYTSGSGVAFSITNISVQEIQADTPRIDFSDSVKGALLLEPQSTNLITYSENLSQWSTVNGVVVTDNFTTSPDGTQNAAKVVYNGTSLGRIEISTGASGTNTQSIYLKTISGTQAVSIGSSTSDLTEVTVTSEWQRFTHTGSGSYPRVLCNDATTIYIWGAQLEQKSFSTSYIPNHGVSGGVTRLADVCNNSGSAQDFSESGVLYAEISALANDLTERRITISDGTTSNRVAIEYTLSSNQIKGRVVSSSSTSANMNFTASSIVDFSKIAISYKQNEFNLWINATKVATDTSGNAPIGLNKISFDNGTGSNAFHGNVRELQVFTEELTDEQLQKLTTI